MMMIKTLLKFNHSTLEVTLLHQKLLREAKVLSEVATSLHQERLLNETKASLVEATSLLKKCVKTQNFINQEQPVARRKTMMSSNQQSKKSNTIQWLISGKELFSSPFCFLLFSWNKWYQKHFLEVSKSDSSSK